MRIFQVLEFNQFNTGSVHQMFQAATGLHDRGHDVTIVSRPGSALEREAAAHGIAFRGLPFRHHFDAGSIRAMRRLVRDLAPDVIHVHKGTSHAITLAATWSSPVGAFVVNRGVSFPLDFWNRMKYRTRRVDLIVTVCRQIKDVVVSSGKISPEKVEVVYAGTDVAGFDPDRHDPRAFRREKGIAEDRFLIAQVGMRDWKGWKELIDAVAEVAAIHSRVHLILIGNIAVAPEVREYAAARGVPDRVTPVEYRADMPNVFASCDLVIDASWAGTGITGTIREAMAMEKPVIATNAGGNDELLSSPDVGWLIPMRDHAALVAAIREVIEHPERAASVARNARPHVVNGFSRELRISRLQDLYSRILRAKGRPVR
ncbi:MAG TPA: glycosyltransferase family 4 protein [Thermoanaerobaculia bacterium]|nr:glycosyltransferase family 4 protein [Thermoanaerobaculia bacterium]